jgi:hypothetical protein
MPIGYRHRTGEARSVDAGSAGTLVVDVRRTAADP